MTLLSTIIFTGCKKEEDSPAPTSIPIVTPPVATTSSNTYKKGSGWNAGTDVNLKVETLSNTQTFWNNMTAPSTLITINLDQTYKYTVSGNSNTVVVTGTYSISSSGALTYNEDGGGNVVGFMKDSQGDIYIYKI